MRPALAAAALAAAILPTAAAAQTQQPAPTIAPVTADEMGDAGQVVVITGGTISDPQNVEFMSEEELAAIPEVPVTYEDETATPAPVAKPGA